MLETVVYSSVLCYNGRKLEKKGSAPMSSAEKYFRTVAFGGFHKQDVMNYITTANKENQEKNSDLKLQAEAAVKEKSELEEKFESAEAARKKNAAECERLSDLLTQRTTALEQSEKELTALKAEHEKVTARLAELEKKVPKLEEDAAAYAALKDHTATIELESHRKAQEIVEQAQAQSAKVRNELEGWLRRVQNSYQHLRTDVSATVSHLINELERGQKAMEEAAPAFKQHDEALAALLECEHTCAGPKAPEPLPLEEEVVEHG